MRWWTGPECPCGAASAPPHAWYRKYHKQGLVVIGFCHHRSPTPLPRRQVDGLVRRYGCKFPVAIDPDWQTLKRWWLDGHDRQWTSGSFLIDREGVIRALHHGGSYTETAARDIEAMIQDLLSGPKPNA